VWGQGLVGKYLYLEDEKRAVVVGLDEGAVELLLLDRQRELMLVRL